MTGDAVDVIWVTPIPPDRAGGGGHIRQAYLVAALAERARVHLVCSRRVTDPQVRAAVASIVEFDFPDPPRLPATRWGRRLLDLWLATGSREPREVASMAAVRKALAPEVARVGAEVVMVECAGLAGLVLPAGMVKVLTLHNVGSVMAEQAAAVDPVWRRRWLWRRDAAKWRRWERRTLKGYDRVMTVSSRDADALGLNHPVVVPNGVDTERFRPSPIPAVGPMLFTGALYTAPNIDGVQWFSTEVLPLIRARVPGARFVIAGLSPPPEILRLAQIDGIEVMADVEDVLPLLFDARVAVVPLRIGSGSRLKILEAMAAGRPVVSTSVGAEGLEVEPGRHLEIADDTAAFARAVCRLLESDAPDMIASARDLVERAYSWPVVAQPFVRAVLEAGSS